MTQWEVLLVIIVVIELIVLVINNFVSPSTKNNLHIAKVIQKNTDAIENLTKEINSLTTDNEKDHNTFFKEINNLNKEVGILKEKHNSDIKLLDTQIKTHHRKD